MIGIGNPDRGDDGAGALVVRLLAARVPAILHRGDASALLELLAGTDHAILVDACAAGVAPGTVLRFEAGAAPLPALRAPLLEHGLDLGAALELARVLGCLPRRCTVHAIEGRCFTRGTGPSEAVTAAAGALAESIAQEYERAESVPCTSSA